jgi:hypothetical protein
MFAPLLSNDARVLAGKAIPEPDLTVYHTPPRQRYRRSNPSAVVLAR